MHARDLRGRRVLDRRQWSSRADPCAGRSRPRSRNGARREALGTRSREPLQGTAAVIVSPTRNHPARRAGARHPAARVCGMRAGDVHGTTGPDSRARRLSVRTASVHDYFKSGCEQQPSPNARETRPQRGRVFRFLRSVFEGLARAVGAAVSRSLNRRVARLPRWPTGWAESLSGSLAEQGAGLRVGRSRWSGHYPRGRPRWFSPEPLRTATRGCCLRSRGGVWCVQVRGQ